MEIENIKGEIIFRTDKDNIKDAIEDAVKSGANLSGANLGGAYLGGANLRGAYLSCADLSGAYLIGANLIGAYLSSADLSGAYLSCADLSGAYLSSADLRSADLSGAYLIGAYLSSADLSGANIIGANLIGANLSGAKNIHYISLACPSDGEFTGWKKVNNRLIRLLIPADAKRSSATTIKCRCEKAKVVAITSLDERESYEEVTNNNYAKLIYKVGEMVYPDSFDDCRWNECSHGIHFFINKQEAINY